MEKNNKDIEKICRGCKRILVGESKLGLCSECFNKYGTVVAVIGAGGLTLLGRKVVKNGGKIAKGAFNLIKHIK